MSGGDGLFMFYSEESKQYKRLDLINKFYSYRFKYRYKEEYQFIKIFFEEDFLNLENLDFRNFYRIR